MYARVTEWNSQELADNYSTMLNKYLLAHSVITNLLIKFRTSYLHGGG